MSTATTGNIEDEQRAMVPIYFQRCEAVCLRFLLLLCSRWPLPLAHRPSCEEQCFYLRVCVVPGHRCVSAFSVACHFSLGIVARIRLIHCFCVLWVILFLSTPFSLSLFFLRGVSPFHRWWHLLLPVGDIPFSIGG